MAVSLANLRAANEKRWAAAKLTRPFNSTADKLLAAKSRYLAVEARTGVPWFVIAVIHQRESSQSWLASLAQGDPWNKVSTYVPKGRGPFKSWEEAAMDALVNCAPYAARNKDWSVGGTLLMLEQYNGLGYATKGVPSPYLWAGTDQYVSGKYVADGVYDTTAVDSPLPTFRFHGASTLVLHTERHTARLRRPALRPRTRSRCLRHQCRECRFSNRV